MENPFSDFVTTFPLRENNSGIFWIPPPPTDSTFFIKKYLSIEWGKLGVNGSVSKLLSLKLIFFPFYLSVKFFVCGGIGSSGRAAFDDREFISLLLFTFIYHIILVVVIA